MILTREIATLLHHVIEQVCAPATVVLRASCADCRHSTRLVWLGRRLGAWAWPLSCSTATLTSAMPWMSLTAAQQSLTTVTLLTRTSPLTSTSLRGHTWMRTGVRRWVVCSLASSSCASGHALCLLCQHGVCPMLHCLVTAYSQTPPTHEFHPSALTTGAQLCAGAVHGPASGAVAGHTHMRVLWH